MPGGDGTGPLGMGPMTGRAAGFCAGYSMPGYANPISGRGGFGFGRGWGRGWFGGGRGRGRGWRNWYGATGLPGWAGYGMGLPAWGGWGAYPSYGGPYGYPYYGAPYGSPYGSELTPQQEADMLKEQAKAIQEELQSINERISTLEKAATEEKK